MSGNGVNGKHFLKVSESILKHRDYPCAVVVQAGPFIRLIRSAGTVYIWTYPFDQNDSVMVIKPEHARIWMGVLKTAVRDK